jgi:hypothetical protein
MGKFDYARKILLNEVTEKKERFIMEIETGYRKWDVIEESFAQYKDCLLASDELAKIQGKEFEEKLKK